MKALELLFHKWCFCLTSPTPGSRQASPTEAVERIGPTQAGLEMMGQHHTHVLQPQNQAHNKPLVEDFQNQEAQNMGGMEQQAGVESLQFDYAGNQIQVDSSGTPVGLFDYNSQQQVSYTTKLRLAYWRTKPFCSLTSWFCFAVVPEVQPFGCSATHCCSAAAICPCGCPAATPWLVLCFLGCQSTGSCVLSESDAIHCHWLQSYESCL